MRRSLVAVAAAIGILVAGTGLAPAEVAQAADDTPVWWRNAAERTLLSPGNAAEPGWEGDRWVGYCDPEEYPEGCAEEGVHRAVWQFEGFDILRELEPEDITSATFILNGETGWLDDVGCTANSLEFYDAPLITPETDWSSTEAWTADKRVGQWSGYWSACEKTPRWTGYFSVDVTQLAVEAARDDRTSLAVGVRAADETCMTCGWNLLHQHAILRINFNRAPLAPSELSIGFLNTKVDCVDEPVLRTTMPFIGAVIPEPDGASHVNFVETATFRLTSADDPGTVLWEGASTGNNELRRFYQVEVPPGILEHDGRYRIAVTGTDNHGLTGPESSCVFRVDTVRPEIPTITPLVGAEAVYVAGRQGRGGPGIPGAFLIDGPGDDDVDYTYVLNGISGTLPGGEHPVIHAIPRGYGRNKLTVRAVDAAGNTSDAVVHEFEVSKTHFFVPTPPAVTVEGPTSWTVGDPAPVMAVTLSPDAVTPYGTVTVSAGATVVGSAQFDARTEELTLDTAAIDPATTALTFTYRAFPGAPEWNESRPLAVTLPDFVVDRFPSISGTVQVGKTLTANRSPWTPTPTTVRYQWRLDGKAVASATSRTWKVPASAKGKKVSVAVTGSHAGYATRTVVSPAATVKAATFVVPKAKISGKPQVGATVKAVRGTWSPQPSTVRYQWKVGGKAVKGATRSSFKIPASAKGKTVTYVVKGSRSGYTTKAVTSAAVRAVR